MSAQFGKWNFEGQSVAPEYFDKVSTLLAPYGPDCGRVYSEGGVRILYRAFHTTKESHRETQPHISRSGAVITWDGRLDNRTELIRELRDAVAMDSPDVAIVAAAYDQWHTACLARLVGDWAVSIWNPNNSSLLLAKDPIGIHHLYYSHNNREVTWSTILDPLVLLAGSSFVICDEYIAGWFSQFPAAHVTPYVGIHAVPPSSFVLLQPGKHTVSRYWDFDPANSIRYKTDAEYDDHFRTVFIQAVQRRLRSDRPVLAELSGGMDSSSIVCIADEIIARGDGECPRLDTISWYNGSDPNDDDPRYFTIVEEKRGRTGFHINANTLKRAEASQDAGQRLFRREFDNGRFAATPFPNIDPSEHSKEYADWMRLGGYRVTLSGIGGDDPTGGGVPTPTPELQNLLARAQFSRLARRLNAWAGKMHQPRRRLLWDAARGFLPPLTIVGADTNGRTAPWFSPEFVRRNRSALRGYSCRRKVLGPLPSFQDAIEKLEGHLRLQAQFGVNPDLLRDARYPYLDRDFLKFLFAVPRGQIVGIGRRRHLMKRALAGIVPDSLLQRRRIAVAQETEKYNAEEYDSLLKWNYPKLSIVLDYIDADGFRDALENARSNDIVARQFLQRIWTFESWLRHLSDRGVLVNLPSLRKAENSLSVEAEKLAVSSHSQISGWLADRKITPPKEGGENHEIRNSTTDGIDACNQCHSGQRQR